MEMLQFISRQSAAEKLLLSFRYSPKELMTAPANVVAFLLTGLIPPRQARRENPEILQSIAEHHPDYPYRQQDRPLKPTPVCTVNGLWSCQLEGSKDEKPPRQRARRALRQINGSADGVGSDEPSPLVHTQRTLWRAGLVSEGRQSSQPQQLFQVLDA